MTNKTFFVSLKHQNTQYFKQLSYETPTVIRLVIGSFNTWTSVAHGSFTTFKLKSHL